MRLEMFAGAALLCFLAQPVLADTHVLARAGGWQAFGGTTNSGRPLCGMSSSSGGRYFGLKYFSGNKTLTIQLGSSKWRIENGAKQKLTMQFDRETPWNATGTGMHFNDGDAGLEYDINRNQLDQFMREFRSSSQINILFLGSTAAAWNGSLSGTGSISDSFMRCIRELK